MSLLQSTRLASLTTPLGEDVMSLRRLHVTEQLGRLFSLEIEAASLRGDIKADDLLGHPVTIEVACPPGGQRYFHGFVNHFSHSPRIGRRYFHYHLTAVPWLWMLTRQTDCRIFQNQSVPDILRDVFGRRGFSAFEMNLQGNHEAWDYCVQYRETDFNFVSRLMEQEGIYYYFRHDQNEHTLVLADSPDAHTPFPNYDKVILRALTSSHGPEEELLREWHVKHHHHSGAYAQTDYDFTRPRVDLATHNALPGEFALPDYEVYDYPGEYTQYKAGEDWAKVRMEEIRAERVVYLSSGNVVGLATGHKFALSGPPGFKDEGDYLVFSTSIHVKSGVFETGSADEETSEESFAVACTLLPAAEPFRAVRLTPKPVIQGVQTAIVTGPKGEEIHTDQYGRIKVQFHWDREGKLDENTTCFIRVGQVWAGKRWGATFIPRIGQEVIVAFLEGDPDQPIVVGSVYNGDQMPPYLGGGPDSKHANDPKVSGVKSLSTKGGAGYNELRFDDNKGSEEVFLHAEKDLDLRVKNDRRENVDHDRFLTVGNDQKALVKANKHQKVTGNHVEAVGGAQSLHVTGDRKQKVDGSTSLTVGKDQQEKVGQKHAVDAGQEIHLKAGMKVVIEAGVQLTIKVGSNHITLDSSGVTIKGTMVNINSAPNPVAGSGSSPASPDAPDAPTEADESKPGSLSSSAATPAPPPPVTPPPKATPAAASSAAGAATPPVAATPGVPGAPPATPPVTPGFFNCVKNAAHKAGEAIEQGKKTVDNAQKAVDAAVAGAHKVEEKAAAAVTDAKQAVDDLKTSVDDAKDTVDHLKKAAHGNVVSEVKAAVKSGKDAVAKAKVAYSGAKKAVDEAKAAVDEAVTDVKAAITAGEELITNAEATIEKTGEAIEAAGQCI